MKPIGKPRISDCDSEEYMFKGSYPIEWYKALVLQAALHEIGLEVEDVTHLDEH